MFSYSWSNTSVLADGFDHAICGLDINHATEDSQESDEALMGANARRIVACVNALAGVATEELEQSGFISGLLEQVECSTITRDNMEGRLNILIVKLAAMKEERDTWQKRAEFSYQERQKLEKQVEGLINQLSAHQRQAAIGKAIERACEELPEGFDIRIECEKGAATVRLYDSEGEEDSEDLYSDSGFGAEIDNAINVAIEKGGA